MSYVDTQAIVNRPSSEPKALNWNIETVKLRADLQDNEVMVDVLSCGICKSDLFAAPLYEGPIVLGHEGTGIVRKVGSKVTNCQPGDPVILSYNSCGDCRRCKGNLTSLCKVFKPINIENPDPEPSFTNDKGEKIIGRWFGQSSFANVTITFDRAIVNLKKYNLTKEQLILMGPLGCGFQTGCGAMINACAPEPEESVAVYGLGGVGFGAIMGAKAIGCKTIIALDVFDSKLELARELGATHTIKNTDPEKTKKLILEITKGEGVDKTAECIGGSKFIEQAIDNAAVCGRIAFVGVSMDIVKLHTYEFVMAGKQLIATVEGNTSSQIFVPRMIEWYLQGKFPLEKLEKIYRFQDFRKALDDVKKGKCVKAVVAFDGASGLLSNKL